MLLFGEQESPVGQEHGDTEEDECAGNFQRLATLRVGLTALRGSSDTNSDSSEKDQAQKTPVPGDSGEYVTRRLVIEELFSEVDD